MRRGLTIWILLPFCLFALNGWAQLDLYRFSRLDITKGLSHNEVNCFLRDETGFLWVGTMSGLDRFDSYKFKIFKHDLRDTTSISDDYVDKLFEGPGHKLWVFTRNGINIYDPLTEKFDRNPQRFLNTLHIPLGNNNGDIMDIKKDNLGNYWFLSSDSGIYKYNPPEKSTTRFFNSKGDPSSLYSNSIASMGLDASGDCWIVYKDGVMEKMVGRTNRVVFRTMALRKTAPGESLNYYLACADRQHDLWLYVLASTKGVFYYNAAKDSVCHIEKGVADIGLNSNIVNGIIQDEQGLIWIATDHGGINLLDKKDFSIRYIMNREDDDKSLSQNSINTIYRDKDGIIWIGTFKQGVSFHHEGITNFPLYRHQIANARNLNYDDVNRFAEDKKGNLWIGTNGGGLVYFNRQTGRFTQYLHDPADPASLTNDIIVSLCMDHEQKLWIGTYYGGMDCFDGKRFRHYRHDAMDTNSIADDRIWDILEDSRQNLWVGTFAEGIDLFDRKKNTFRHYKPLAPNSVQSGYITGLAEDSAGNLWIATAYGIDVLERSSGLFHHYGHDDTHPTTSLSNNNTNSIRVDSRGLIWVASREGLDVLDPVTDQFSIFRAEGGLPDNTILDILEDKSHNLWLSTPNGLSNAMVSMDPVTRKITCQFRNYDESDGLQGREFNANAAFRTNSGEMVFGGAYGFNIFNPQNIRHSDKSQVLILTGLQVFNKSVDIGEKLNGHIILPRSISGTKEITLRYNENVFSIEYAALDFSNPEKVKYAYQLEEFDKDWNDVGTRHLATYTNLDPGKYVFRVRVQNPDGKWSAAAATIQLIITPPFWLTWWFKLAVLASIAGSFVAFYRFRVRIIKAQRTRLLQQVQEQTRQLRESARETELTNKELERKNKDLEQFAYVTSHDLQEPLRTTSSFVKLLQQDYGEKLDETADKYLTYIAESSARMKVLITDLLEYSRIGSKKELQPVDANTMLRAVLDDLGAAINESGAEIKAEPLPVISGYPTEIKQLFQNLIINAIKFTRKDTVPKINISAKKKGDYWQFAFADNGIGIEEQHKEKIFVIFQRLHSRNEYPGSGIGLSNCKKIVELHKGKIWLESTPGEGTTFYFTLQQINT